MLTKLIIASIQTDMLCLKTNSDEKKGKHGTPTSCIQREDPKKGPTTLLVGSASTGFIFLRASAASSVHTFLTQALMVFFKKVDTRIRRRGS